MSHFPCSCIQTDLQRATCWDFSIHFHPFLFLFFCPVGLRKSQECLFCVTGCTAHPHRDSTSTSTWIPALGNLNMAQDAAAAPREATPQLLHPICPHIQSLPRWYCHRVTPVRDILSEEPDTPGKIRMPNEFLTHQGWGMSPLKGVTGCPGSS